MTTTNTRLSIDPARIEQDIVELARYTNPDVPYTRLAFTDLDKQAREVVSGWMGTLGLTLRTDAAGNMIGLRKGAESGAPALVIGSHVDTVYAGGRFDGIAGVVTALAIVRALNDAGITTRHPIEVINFTCEEPTVTGLTPFGSQARAGVLDQSRIPEAFGPEGRPLGEAIHLPAERVALYGDVHQPEPFSVQTRRLLSQQDRPRAGAPDRHAGPRTPPALCQQVPSVQ